MARKINLKKVAKPVEGAATAAKAETVETTEKPKKKVAAARMHDVGKLSYAGASPTIRGHGRKLSPVNPALGAGKVTERDETFIKDIRKVYGTRPFARLDADAGCVRRAMFHKFLEHVSGDLGSRDATFRVTSKGMGYGAK